MVALPTKPQTRAGLGITPMNARILLLGVPKVGKSTLAGTWAPDKTLFIDTQHGTDMLDGEHYVQHISSWQDFEDTIDLVANGGHKYETIVIDTIDDVYKFADSHAGGKSGKVAAGLVEYGKGTAEAEGLFRRAIGKLLATPHGAWFLGHVDMIEIDKQQKAVPMLDKRVRNYVTGACGFILIAERQGPRRVLHTEPSARYEAGARVPLPEPLEMDSRALYTAMAAGLNGGATPNGKQKKETTS